MKLRSKLRVTEILAYTLLVTFGLHGNTCTSRYI